MQNIVTSYCLEGHQAKILCLQKDCTFPALMCEILDCQSAIKHQRCHNNIQISELYKQILRKQEKDIQKSNTISQLYNSLIKSLQRDRLQHQSYLQIGKKPQDLNLLLKFFKSGQALKIFPNLVLKVSNNLKDYEDQNTSFYNNLKRKINSKEQVMNKAISSLRQLWKPNENLFSCSTPEIYRFSNQLRAKSFWNDPFQIRQSGIIIQKIHHYGEKWCTALIQPPIQKSSKIIFKIVNNYDHCFGIFSKRHCEQKQYTNMKSICDGAHIINQQGFIDSNDKSKKIVSTGFKYFIGNFIQIQCNLQTLTLKIQNLTLECLPSANIKFTKQQNDEIYFGVTMFSQGSIVQII